MFREKSIKSRLMLAEPDENTRFKFTIWFDYTRQLVNDIQDGDLVAVPNFSSTPEQTRFSILEITNVMPSHYAMGTNKSDLRGYPGYLMESAGNLPTDWTEQEDKPTEDITKIVCEAIPINLEFHDIMGATMEDIPIEKEGAMPMVGSKVNLLSKNFTQRIMNLSIDIENDNNIQIGNLLRDEDVKIYTTVNDLIQTHIGIFGFTGVGKSNLVSTTISKILLNSKQNEKILLFDLMGEYTGLLIDLILNDKVKCNIICLGKETLPQPVIDYISSTSKRNVDIDDAVNSFLNHLHLPKSLRRSENKYYEPIKDVIIKNKIKIYQEVIEQNVNQFLNQIHDDIFDKTTDEYPGIRIELEDLVKNVFEPHKNEDLDKKLASVFIDDIEKIKEEKKEKYTKGIKKRIDRIIRALQLITEKEDKDEINQGAIISLGTLLSDINWGNDKSLYLFISHNPNKMRRFSNNLGFWVSETRRRNGKNSPLVLFMFDEADEFIPREASGSYEKSRKIIETLARRGRKFGLGVGIATQRSSYLDTKIMGQLHTYLISKLPRKYDRDVVGEAFAMSEDIFTQTFKFTAGNWLLISHEATGLSSVPIPIKTENAEKRITDFLDGYNE